MNRSDEHDAGAGGDGADGGRARDAEDGGGGGGTKWPPSSAVSPSAAGRTVRGPGPGPESSAGSSA